MDTPQPTAPANASPVPPESLSTPGLPKQPEALLPAPQKGNGSWGAALGIVIILLVLIVGALYFWGAKLAEEEQSGFVPEEEVVLEDIAQ